MMDRPQSAPTYRSVSGRMRNDATYGEWVKLRDYAAWRDYALALESKLRQAAPLDLGGVMSKPHNEPLIGKIKII